MEVVIYEKKNHACKKQYKEIEDNLIKLSFLNNGLVCSLWSENVIIRIVRFWSMNIGFKVEG